MATVCTEQSVLTRSRLADYAELTKPRISLLVLFTVAAGAYLGSRQGVDLVILCHTLLGTTLVAAGASALNQLFERDTDRLMRRTENRPLPAGRLQPAEVAFFGSALGIVGIAYLVLMLPHLWSALVAAITFVCYVFVYTPLKRLTPFNTLIGAVPGALPPVIGWVAVRGELGMEVVALFLIIFLWQVPHFLAIAWIYRDDYARAGLKMLPVVDRDGVCTGRQMVTYCLALIPVSLFPPLLGASGPLYLLGAMLLGVGFLTQAIAFNREHSVFQARRVLRASLVYLPALLILLLLDGLSKPVALALWP